MPRNIEIKARIPSVESLEPIVASLATQGPTEIAQDDTFFYCDSGRLKIRIFSATEGELIYYRRTNEPGPKESFYLRAPTASPEVLRETLSLAYGQVGRVVKRRTLYLVGRTRVHLDRVEGLGHFLELEVVLEDDEPCDSGVREAHALMGRLSIEPSTLIETAYVDLLAQGALERPDIGPTSA
jgi:predicted adenylyl cyclase CyaB